MNKNQMACNKINQWKLPEDVQAVVEDTDFNVMDELFGSVQTPEELIEIVRENFIEHCIEEA